MIYSKDDVNLTHVRYVYVQYFHWLCQLFHFKIIKILSKKAE
jgi:hypothetical protein